MTVGAASRGRILALVLLALPGLVYCPPGIKPLSAQSKRAKGKEPPKAAPQAASPSTVQSGLPAAVAEMREAILSAVRSGLIEDLKTAIEWNEMKPELAGANADDPIAHLKQLSGDGEGREMLAILGNLLEGAHTVVPLGRDLENNRVFVWPAIADKPLAGLTPAEEVELLRLVPVAAAKEMKAKGKYAFWRLMIGADGTWHSFNKMDP